MRVLHMYFFSCIFVIVLSGRVHRCGVTSVPFSYNEYQIRTYAATCHTINGPS